MWILDSEGDFLEGKRVWLRPGKKYLFGRIKREGGTATLPEGIYAVQQQVLTTHFRSPSCHSAFFDIPKTHGD
jgi:hypothetical protein